MRHGLAVWIGMTVVFALSVPLAVRIRVVWRTRRSSANALSAMDSAVRNASELSQARDIMIAGRLVCEGGCVDLQSGETAAVLTARIHDGSHPTLRAKKLYVELGTSQVELIGPVDLEQGKEQAAWNALTQPSRDKLREALKLNSYEAPLSQFHALHSHESVVARGRLELSASSEGSKSYRESAQRWILRAEEGEDTIALAAAGPVRVAMARWPTQVAWGTLGALLWIVLGGLVGKYSLKRAEDAQHEFSRDPRAFSLPPMGPVSLAAVSPFHRDEALKLALYRIPDTATPELLDAKLALAQEVGGCKAVLSELAKHGQWREILSRIEGCGDAEYRSIPKSHAWASLSEFAKASDLLPKGVGHKKEAIVHLLALQWQRAAILLRSEADTYDPPRSEPLYVEAYDRFQHAAYLCLAFGAEAKAGDITAFGKLRAGLKQAGRDICSLVLADLLPPEERRALLESHPPSKDPPSMYSHKRLHSLLLLEVSDPNSPPRLNGFRSYLHMRGSSLPRFNNENLYPADLAMALRAYGRFQERKELAPLARRYRADLATRIAALAGVAMLSGDASAAIHQAQSDYEILQPMAKSEYTLGEHDYLSDKNANGVLASQLYRVGDFQKAGVAASNAKYSGAFVSAMVQLRRERKSTLFLQETTLFSDEDWPESLNAALAGDSAGLEAEMLRYKHHFAHAASLFGWLLPPQKKAELAEILRLIGPRWSSASPLTTLGNDSIHEMAAANLGDFRHAAALRERLGRTYKALSRPEIAVYLMLLQDL